jgi:hypothetical protein
MKSTIHQKSLLLAVSVAIIFTGCASVPSADHFKKIEGVPDAKPEPGQSVVYFYREKKFVGSAITYYIYDSDKKIGGLKTGTYFYYVASLGEHTFCAETETKVCKTLQLQVNTVYYIRGDVDLGFWVGRPNLTIVSNLEGKATIPNLQHAILLSEEEIKAMEAEKIDPY